MLNAVCFLFKYIITSHHVTSRHVTSLIITFITENGDEINTECESYEVRKKLAFVRRSVCLVSSDGRPQTGLTLSLRGLTRRFCGLRLEHFMGDEIHTTRYDVSRSAAPPRLWDVLMLLLFRLARVLLDSSGNTRLLFFSSSLLFYV